MRLARAYTGCFWSETGHLVLSGGLLPNCELRTLFRINSEPRFSPRVEIKHHMGYMVGGWARMQTLNRKMKSRALMGGCRWGHMPQRVRECSGEWKLAEMHENNKISEQLIHIKKIQKIGALPLKLGGIKNSGYSNFTDSSCRPCPHFILHSIRFTTHAIVWARYYRFGIYAAGLAKCSR